MKLSGKVAIITGAAQGLGRVYAERLSQEGAKVVIVDIVDTAEAKRAIEERGGEVLALSTDVTDEKSTEEMARRTIERFGRIDVLVNNAAIYVGLSSKLFCEVSGQEWDKVMQVNLKGVFLCCKAVYPQMKKQGKGKIINVSSGVFFKGSPYLIHYVTSKGGIIGFTRALASEVGDDGISVNAIAPGYTLSDGIKRKPIGNKEFERAKVTGRCFKRDEQPEDLTGTVVFLASDESDFITGQTIVVDGGSAFH